MGDGAPSNLEEWEVLLLRSTDSRTVKEYGERLTDLLQHFRCCGPLLQLTFESRHEAVRQLAAILLRQHIVRYWNKLKKPQQASMKKGLLGAILRERVKAVGIAIVELTAATAVMCTPLSAGWPDLMPFIRNSATQGRPPGADGADEADANSAGRIRALSLRLLRVLLVELGGEFKGQLPAICQFLMTMLKDQDPEVRIPALESLVACIDIATHPNEAKVLFAVLSQLISFMKDRLSKPELEEETLVAIDFFRTILSCDVPVVDGKVGQLVSMFLDICSNKKLSQTIRSAAMLFFHHASSFTKKEFLASKKLGLVVTLGFSYAAEFDDDEAEIEAVVTPYEAGCELIDHLADTLKASHMYKPTVTIIINWLKSANYRQRRVAITALGLLANPYCEEVATDLMKILPLVANSMTRDPNSIVREAACVSMALLSDHVQPEMSQQHEKIIPLLVRCLDDPDRKVKHKALLALTSYTQHLDFDIGRYLGPLVSRLLRVLENGELREQEMALTTISTLAAAADTAFKPFAPPVLRFCKAAMENDDPQKILLRARATECLGLVATSIGADFMKPYVKGFLTLALKGLKHPKAHELSEFTVSLFANFASMLGTEFTPFCKVIVPIVIDIALADDNPHRTYLQEGPVQKSDSRNTIRESFIDDKSMAVTALGAFASHVGSHFLPWLEDSINTLYTLVKHYHPDIRKAVFQSLVHCLGALYMAMPADEQWVAGEINNKTVNPEFYKALAKIMQLFLGAVMAESDPDVVGAVLKGISDIACIVGPAAIKRDFLEQIKMCIFALLTRKTACQRKRGDDMDEDDDRDMVQLYYDATDLLLELSKPFGAAYHPFFESSLPLLLRFCQDSSPIPYREGAIGTIAEVIRNIDSCSPYVQKIWPSVLSAVQQRDPQSAGLRRNAAYCIGIIAMTGEKTVLPMLGKMANLLKPLLADKSPCSDNAAGALARIGLHALAHDHSMPFAEILKAVLSALPITSDYEPLTPIVDLVVELFRDEHLAPSLAPISPLVVSKLAPMLIQSIRNRERRNSRATPLTEQQESMILEDELESLLRSVFVDLFNKYSSQLQPTLGDLEPSIRDQLLSIVRN